MKTTVDEPRLKKLLKGMVNKERFMQVIILWFFVSFNVPWFNFIQVIILVFYINKILM